jgi:hypothetical protein
MRLKLPAAPLRRDLRHNSGGKVRCAPTSCRELQFLDIIYIGKKPHKILGFKYWRLYKGISTKTLTNNTASSK